jgi:uncharacterized GH25 family protein
MIVVCTISGKLVRADGTPIANQHVVATICSTMDDQGGQVACGVGVSSEQLEAFTDCNGNFAIDLLQNAVFMFEIPAINLRKKIKIPAQTTANFTTLI